jgi:hypothetical protein
MVALGPVRYLAPPTSHARKKAKVMLRLSKMSSPPGSRRSWVRKERLWCYTVTVMVLYSDGYGVMANVMSSSPGSRRSWGYSGVTVVLQWCYCGVTVVL